MGNDEENRYNYKGVKNDSCQEFCEHPSQKHLSQNYSSFKKHKSNKMCFMAVHKSLMFAISHAAWQTLQAFVKTPKVYFTSYESMLF